jgi:hypothetical protein
MQTEGLGGQQLKLQQPKLLLEILLVYKVRARPPAAATERGRGGKGLPAPRRGGPVGNGCSNNSLSSKRGKLKIDEMHRQLCCMSISLFFKARKLGKMI